MHCIDNGSRRPVPSLRLTRVMPLALAALMASLAGCTLTRDGGAPRPTSPTPPPPAPTAAAGPSAPVAPGPAPAPSSAPGAAPGTLPKPAGPAAGATPAPAPAAVSRRPPRYVKLDAPATPRDEAELRLQFARRLVAAHPDTSYTSASPPRLLAIPVIEVELHGDGSVRHIQVLRHPKTGNEATQLAIDAVRRAAPYGAVTHLRRPWKVVETFLFDDELRFKPRTLDTN